MGIYSIADCRFRIAEGVTAVQGLRFRVQENQHETNGMQNLKCECGCFQRLLKQINVVSRAVNDPVNQDRLRAHGVENKIIVNNKIAVSEPGEFLFRRNSTESGVVSESCKPGLNFVGKLFGGDYVILRNKRDDFGEIVFRDPEELDRKLTRAHEAFS